MIRDKRKPESYFNDYIAYQRDRIEKKEHKMNSSSSSSAVSRINLTLLNYKTDLLIALFSSGADASSLIEALDDAVSTAKTLGHVDYETLLILLSFSVILENHDAGIELSGCFHNMVESDRMLNCFSTYLKGGGINWSGPFELSIFGKLTDLDHCDDRSALLLSYLDDWYQLHQSASWFESDKSDKDTYVGYWSFETAALARLFEVDDTALKASPYYPFL